MACDGAGNNAIRRAFPWHDDAEPSAAVRAGTSVPESTPSTLEQFREFVQTHRMHEREDGTARVGGVREGRRRSAGDPHAARLGSERLLRRSDRTPLDDMTMEASAEKRADVVVIGGGIIGSATAYHLAKRGAQVVLVEKGSVGSEQ